MLRVHPRTNSNGLCLLPSSVAIRSYERVSSFAAAVFMFLNFLSELTTSPLDHRQGRERVLPKSINRQLNEPSMEARARPRGGDSRDERAREAEPS